MAPMARKVYGSTAYSMMNAILVVVNDGLPEKWTKHGGGMDRGFERSFLSLWSSPRLEIGTYQLVSLRGSI